MWIRRWFYRIISEIIKKPNERFETVPNLLREAIFELENVISKSKERISQELRFTQKLRFKPEHYNQSIRVGRLGKLLDKDQGEEVYWFETICKDEYTKGNFSTTIPTADDLNLKKYKKLLLDILIDTLEIIGFDVEGIKLKTLEDIISIDNFE